MELNKNTILITIGTVAAVFLFLVGAYLLIGKSAPAKTYPDVVKIASDDHVKWAKQSKNILVEYSDLQCPACQALHSLIKSQLENGDSYYMKNITFVYRHFPLDQHQNSHVAAYAAEAAGRQGKFFEMSDKLFDTQTVWGVDANPGTYFETYAKELGLNIEQFNNDRDSKAVKDRVARDIASGQQFELEATPTFYYNGKKLEYANFDDFKKQLKDFAVTK
jgi:protein-disulfide isomerase